MRIGVIGAGALGLFYGAMLQRAGHDVRFLLRSDFEAINARGLKVFSIDGDFELPTIKGYRTSAEIGPVDLVLIGLKTFANQQLIELVRPLVGRETAILTLQNGVGNEDLLAAAFGEDKVLGGVAFLCSNRGEPGEVHHLGEGRIHLGEWTNQPSIRSQQLAAHFKAAGVACETSDDLIRTRWEKLVWNIPFNGLCALTGKTVTELLQHPPTRQLIASMMHEVIRAANQQGLKIAIEAEPFVEHMLAFSDPMTGYRPSMMIDRLEGRQLELEAIYAIPLQRALTAGTQMPQVDMLYRLLSVGEQFQSPRLRTP
ncbi:putative 2-dehydropantoate 2-reductase [Geopsychrobacter electrodiphilus]|uniref:putative 2-dehydropantoate 2-reductase n=1 Tax=Geopsychrobacter electrodiphilus TaxID=225196 RepID=UPI0003776D28|nr:putative 2-dehydropantoate 2-reductase [Geopsychrobacter electrodiphilus]